MTRLDLDFVQRTSFPWLATVFLVLSLGFCARQVIVWIEWRGQIPGDRQSA